MNSESEEDYLKALYHLQKESDEVTTNSIAEFLEMKPSSVTDMLKKLSENLNLQHMMIGSQRVLH